jgi:hypothetical protein
MHLSPSKTKLKAHEPVNLKGTDKTSEKPKYGAGFVRASKPYSLGVTVSDS